MKISEFHWVTSLAEELRLLEVLPGVAEDAQIPTSSPLTPAQSWLVSSVSPCALCSEKPDREEHGVLETLPGEWRQTRFWLYPASSQTTAQLLDTNCPENQPTLGRRCCRPWIWCRPRKTSGLTDLPVSLGTTSIQTWRGACRRHSGQPLWNCWEDLSQETLLLELCSPRRNITRGLFRGKAKLCWSQREFSAVLKESWPSSTVCLIRALVVPAKVNSSVSQDSFIFQSNHEV